MNIYIQYQWVPSIVTSEEKGKMFSKKIKDPISKRDCFRADLQVFLFLQSFCPNYFNVPLVIDAGNMIQMYPLELGFPTGL